MAQDNEIYATGIVLHAVLPLLRHIAAGTPALAAAFAGKSGTIAVTAGKGDAMVGTSFRVEDGGLVVVPGPMPDADVAIAFGSEASMNAFFAGGIKGLPAIRGALKRGDLFRPFLKTLLRMASLLKSKGLPKTAEDRELLVRSMFYLLSSGISRLNKLGYPSIAAWAKKSPDRVYSWSVEGRPELSAWIRVKAGNSKAGRGEWSRSRPFFDMRFESVDAALGTLLEIDDMFEASASGRIRMLGGPEYGSALGEYMMVVGAYAKGQVPA